MSNEKYVQITLEELFSEEKLQQINESKLVEASEIDWGADREKLLKNSDTSIKDQNGPTCTAYATIAAMENKLGGTIDLSEFDLWYKYRKSNIDLAIAAAQKNYIGEEKYWPEGHSRPSAGYIGRCRLSQCNYLGRDFLKVTQAIDANNPCIVAMATPNQLGENIEQIDPTSGVGKMGHALCVSGYKVKGGKAYFLVKNSWGNKPYQYQYVPFELYKSILHIYFYEVVTVEDKNKTNVI